MKRQGKFTVPPRLQALMSGLAPFRRAVLEHPLYSSIQDEAALRCFMAQHCFVVWDFMTLLKFLQRRLTGIELPWRPVSDPETCRLINEIVLGEESDEDGRGAYRSHFELYNQAMEEAGADRGPLQRFLAKLGEGRELVEALQEAEVPQAAREFVATTWELVSSGSVPAVAAAFTLGREDLVPEMFLRLVAGLRERNPNRWERLHFYLERHIQLDGEEHGPMALRLLAQCCGEDERHWLEAEWAARLSLEARRRLWDAIWKSLG